MEQPKPTGRPRGPSKDGAFKMYGGYIRVSHMAKIKDRAKARKVAPYEVIDEMIAAGLAALPVVPGLAEGAGEGE